MKLIFETDQDWTRQVVEQTAASFREDAVLLRDFSEKDEDLELADRLDACAAEIESLLTTGHWDMPTQRPAT